MNDIIIPAKYRRGLDNAEYQVNAAHALLENIIEPMIHCTRCEGLLIEYAEQTGGDLNKAARAWMEENIDVLYAAEYAAQQLLSEANQPGKERRFSSAQGRYCRLRQGLQYWRRTLPVPVLRGSCGAWP